MEQNKIIRKIIQKGRSELRKVLPSNIFAPIDNALRLRFDPQFKDDYVQYRSFGELNPDKTFYVLRYDFPKAGIYTVCFDFLPQFEWAEAQGYIPIVDMEHYRLPLWGETDAEGNLWEMYFQQVSNGISLDKVYKSKNVILGWKNGMDYKNPFIRPNWNCIETFDNKSIKHWSRVFNRYVVLNQNILKRADKFYDEHMKGKRILGVAMRESYRWCALRNPELGNAHPVLLTPEQSIQQVEQYMEEWKCNYVFLVSDDEECASKFREYYTDQCILYNRSRCMFFVQGKPVIEARYKEDVIEERVKNYLIEIELLSRCTSIVSGMTSGTGVALLRNHGKYEHSEIYDLGRYHFKF